MSFQQPLLTELDILPSGKREKFIRQKDEFGPEKQKISNQDRAGIILNRGISKHKGLELGATVTKEERGEQRSV